MSNRAYAWLGSLVAAAIPTGAIILQMAQQTEALRQQLTQIEQQNALAQQQLDADARDRLARETAQLDAIVSQNFDVLHRGSLSEQNTLARMLALRFGEDACSVLRAWADTSTSAAQWQAITAAAPTCAFSAPEGCGRVYLAYADPRDADKLHALTEALQAQGCHVLPPVVRSDRSPGVYGAAEPSEAAAQAVRAHLRRAVPVQPRSHSGHIEIVLADL